jgi:hypothetical protein
MISVDRNMPSAGKADAKEIRITWCCGFVHHSIIDMENPTRCHSASKFYFIFIWSLTCFGRQTAHHEAPKTTIAASVFACVEGCWTCGYWALSGSVCQRPATTHLTTFHVCKTRGCQCSLGSWWWAVCPPKHVALHINMK